MNKIIVKKESELLAYLFEVLHTKPKKEVKQLLSKKMIQVNQQTITQFNHPLHIDDTITIGKSVQKTSLDILYEDHELIVINKPSGLLSMSNHAEKEKTAYHLVGEYLKSKNPKAMVFIVHRLDQLTSGVLVFAKNNQIKNKLQERWNDIVSIRGYNALVEGKVIQKQGTIKSYLKETKTQLVYSTSEKEGKFAITHYRVLKSNKNYTLLDVLLDTGRKNQIRVHMKDMGHPIVGDSKYGASTNPIRRMGLHSYCVELTHPTTNKRMKFVAPLPEVFLQPFK